MEKNLPTWLTPTKRINDKRVVELDKMCHSWATLAPHVTKLSQDECKYVLRKELIDRDPPRPEFIARMFFRIVRIDRECKWEELQHVSPGCGYRTRNGAAARA